MVTAGAGYAVTESLVMDLALAAGLTPDAPDLQVLTGFTWNFGRVLPGALRGERR